jgi:hypothetical protein
MIVTGLLSRAARKKARFDLEESMQKQRDRSTGQLILAVSDSYKKQQGTTEFSEDEMRVWAGSEAVRLHAALHWLKTEGRAKRAAIPSYWLFD